MILPNSTPSEKHDGHVPLTFDARESGLGIGLGLWVLLCSSLDKFGFNLYFLTGAWPWIKETNSLCVPGEAICAIA